MSSLLLDPPTNNDILQLLVKLEADFNNMQSKMNEHVLHRKKPIPAFMASLGRDFTCSANQAVIFDRVHLNQGSGYDSRHGVFRASKNGTYHFSATFTALPKKEFHIVFVKNLSSNHVGYLYADSNLSFWQERTSSILLHLNAGDDVWLSCLGGSTTAGDTDTVNDYRTYHSHFSGFMISED